MESKIIVSLRIKPLSNQELQNQKVVIWSKISDTTIMNKRTNEVYHFDRVFGDTIDT